MRSAATAKVTAAFIALVALTAAAGATEWRIVKVTGDLWVDTPGVQRVALTSPADNVPDGATLVTGGNARVLLSRGSETIVIGPNAVLALPRQLGQFTTIEQRAGEVEFDVEKQNLQHFAVETPFLAAVVKGTQFIVRVGTSDANVSVSRGLVEVGNLTTGQTADVAPGQSAAVDGKTGRMSVLGNVEIKPGMPRLPAVKPLSSPDLNAMQSVPAAKSGDKPFDVADAGAAVAASRIIGGGPGGDTGSGGGFAGTGPRGSSVGASSPNDGASAERSSLDSGASGGGPSVTLASAGDSFVVRRKPAANDTDVSSLTGVILAGSFAAMALLGIGFAYVRARF